MSFNTKPRGMTSTLNNKNIDEIIVYFIFLFVSLARSLFDSMFRICCQIKTRDKSLLVHNRLDRHKHSHNLYNLRILHYTPQFLSNLNLWMKVISIANVLSRGWVSKGVNHTRWKTIPRKSILFASIYEKFPSPSRNKPLNPSLIEFSCLLLV